MAQQPRSRRVDQLECAPRTTPLPPARRPARRSTNHVPRGHNPRAHRGVGRMSSDTPDLSVQLRSIAGQVLSGDSLVSFVKYAPLDAYTTSDGQIDEEKVMGH